MKKVLVTGAAGEIGFSVIKYLLSEGKYEITALDLKNKCSYQKLKKYRKRINILYGDVEDPVLINALVKDQDFIIHCVGIMPPICNLKKDFLECVEYHGLETIMQAISYYNEKCHLIYLSTTTMYEGTKNIGVTSRIRYEPDDYYSKYKEKGEKLIIEKLKNYTIYRIPFVLGALPNKSLYCYQKQAIFELITLEDLTIALVKTIDKHKVLNKKIKILSGGENLVTTREELLMYILKGYGLSFSLLWNMLFNPVSYKGQVFKKDDALDELLTYKTSSISSYFIKLHYPKRTLARNLAKPYIKYLERVVK